MDFNEEYKKETLGIFDDFILNLKAFVKGSRKHMDYLGYKKMMNCEEFVRCIGCPLEGACIAFRNPLNEFFRHCLAERDKEENLGGKNCEKCREFLPKAIRYIEEKKKFFADTFESIYGRITSIRFDYRNSVQIRTDRSHFEVILDLDDCTGECSLLVPKNYEDYLGSLLKDIKFHTGKNWVSIFEYETQSVKEVSARIKRISFETDLGSFDISFSRNKNDKKSREKNCRGDHTVRLRKNYYEEMEGL